MSADGAAANAAASRDLHDIWRSELAALATDRELREGFAGAAQAWMALLERHAGPDGPGGRPGPDAAPGAAAAPTAADAHGGGAERLRAWIDALRGIG